MTEPLLSVNRLVTRFPAKGKKDITVVDDVSFHVNKGEIVAIVGESGSGKSMTSLSIMGLLKSGGKVTGGTIAYRGKNLLQLPKKERRKINGREMTMIFQEPMSSLNPMLRIKTQIAEALKIHNPQKTKKEIHEKVIHLLEQVEIADAEAVANRFPHQLSGGMRQRVMIAIALANEPQLLIADEPTTALDVTIQKQILTLIKNLNEKKGTGVIFITHDLSVVAAIADRVIVMYKGQIVEEADVFELFDNPIHPYTIRLMKAMPTLDTKMKVLEEIPKLIDLENRKEKCPLHTNGALAMNTEEDHPLIKVSDSHYVRCFCPEKEGAENETGK